MVRRFWVSPAVLAGDVDYWWTKDCCSAFFRIAFVDSVGECFSGVQKFLMWHSDTVSVISHSTIGL